MAINVSIQYHGGFLPDILLLEGLSGGCRAGLTLKRCSHAILPVD